MFDLHATAPTRRLGIFLLVLVLLLAMWAPTNVHNAAEQVAKSSRSFTANTTTTLTLGTGTTTQQNNHGTRAEALHERAVALRNKKNRAKKPRRPKPASQLLSNVSTPILVMGLNKCGTTSLADYFACGGVDVSHWMCDRRHRRPSPFSPTPNNHHRQRRLTGVCGMEVYRNIQAGRQPFDNMPIDYTVYAEFDMFGPEVDSCFYPQHSHLHLLHRAYPTATWILNTRNATDWAHSVQQWRGTGDDPHGELWENLIACDLPPALPPGVGGTTAELVRFFESHTARVQAFVSEYSNGTTPPHLVQVAIDQPNAGVILERAFGISRSCWGQANRNPS